MFCNVFNPCSIGHYGYNGHNFMSFYFKGHIKDTFIKDTLCLWTEKKEILLK